MQHFTNKQLPTAFFIAVLLALSHHSSASGFESFSATYQIAAPTRVVAEMTISATQDKQRIHYQSRVVPRGFIGHLVGLRAQSDSEILIRPRELIPLQYEKQGANKSKRQFYQFDWQKLEAAITYKGDNYLLAITRGVVDENTLQLKLRQDVAQSDTQPFDRSYQILSDGRLKKRRFVKTGSELINSPLGRVDTIRIERYKDGIVDQVYWMSPTHHYLPARIEKLKNGKVKTRITLVALQ